MINFKGVAEFDPIEGCADLLYDQLNIDGKLDEYDRRDLDDYVGRLVTNYPNRREVRVARLYANRISVDAAYICTKLRNDDGSVKEGYEDIESEYANLSSRLRAIYSTLDIWLKTNPNR